MCSAIFTVASLTELLAWELALGSANLLNERLLRARRAYLLPGGRGRGGFAAKGHLFTTRLKMFRNKLLTYTADSCERCTVVVANAA